MILVDQPLIIERLQLFQAFGRRRFSPGVPGGGGDRRRIRDHFLQLPQHRELVLGDVAGPVRAGRVICPG